VSEEFVIVASILLGFLALSVTIVLIQRRHLAKLRAAAVVEAPIVSQLRLGVSTLVLIGVAGLVPLAAVGLGFGPEYALQVTLVTVVVALLGVALVVWSPWSRVGAVVLDGERLTLRKNGDPDVVIALSRPWELVVMRSAELVSVAALQDEQAISFSFTSYDAFEAPVGVLAGPDLGAAGKVLHERLVAAQSPK
jgi:hypothetical protein